MRNQKFFMFWSWIFDGANTFLMLQKALHAIWSSYYSHQLYLKNTIIMYGSRPQSLFWSFLSAYINARRVSSSIDSLEYCSNLKRVSLFYYYYKGLLSGELGNHLSKSHFCIRCTRLFRRVHSFVVYWPVELTMHYQFYFPNKTYGKC